MKQSQAEKVFRKFAKTRGLDVKRMTVSDAFDLLTTFYEQHLCEECDRSADGDMLLFQYGLYDWGHGEIFEVDFVRQFTQVDSDGDDGMEQLHITFRFDPAVAATTKSFEIWNSQCKDAADFQARVHSSDGFRAASTAAPRRIEIRQEEI